MNYSEIDGDADLLLKPLPHTNVNQLITEWKALPREPPLQAEPLCYLVLTHLKEMQWWEIKQDIKLWRLCRHILINEIYCMGEVVVLGPLLCAS